MAFDLTDLLNNTSSSSDPDSEQKITQDAQAAPVNPAYTNLLNYYKSNSKNAFGTPEQQAAEGLDALNSAAIGDKPSTNYGSGSLLQLKDIAGDSGTKNPISDTQLNTLLTQNSSSLPATQSPEQQLLSSVGTDPSATSPANILKQKLAKLRGPSSSTSAPGPSLEDQINSAQGMGQVASPIAAAGDPKMADKLALLAQAKQNAANTNLSAGIGKAADLIGAAMAHTGTNNAVYDDLEKNADNDEKNVLNQDKLESDNLKDQELSRKLKDETDSNNPSSPKSVAYREQANEMLKQLGSPGLSNNVSATDLEKQLPLIYKRIEMKENAANRSVAREGIQSSKDMMLQSNVIKDTQNMIETARGAKDVQNAKETMRLVNNARSVLQEAPNGDLNQIPQAQVALFAQEMGKIAKGGVAGHEEVRDIMPSSVASRLMKGLSDLENNPNGAKLGAFLQTYQPYLDDVYNNSHQLVGDRMNRILQGQGLRLPPHMRQDFDTSMRGIYPDAGGVMTKAAAKGKPQPGQVINYKGSRYTVGADGETLTPIQ